MNDVNAFLDRCDDVLGNWQGSSDSMHAIGYEVVDVEFDHPRFGWLVQTATEPPPTIPTVPLVEFNGWAFSAAMQALAREMDEAFRPILDALYDGCERCRRIGTALHQQVGEADAIGADTDDGLPADPRERALYLRQHRNTGPHTHRLDGRRR